MSQNPHFPTTYARLLVLKVGAGGNNTSDCHRLQHFPEYKVIINQPGRCVIQGVELEKMTVCPSHRRKLFARVKFQIVFCISTRFSKFYLLSVLTLFA